jgi:hypothetical protein
MSADPDSANQPNAAPSDTPTEAFAKYPLQLVGISVGDLMFAPQYRALDEHLREKLPEKILKPDFLTSANMGTTAYELGVVYANSDSEVAAPHRDKGIEYDQLGPILPSAYLTVISHNTRAISLRSWFLPAAETDELVDWFMADRPGDWFALPFLLRKAVDIDLFSPTIGQLGDDRFRLVAQVVWALPDVPDDYYGDEWREVSNTAGLGYPRWTGRGCVLFENPFATNEQPRWNWLIPLSSLSAAVTDTYPALAAARAYGDYLTETFHLPILVDAVAKLRWADAARLPARVGSPQLGRLAYRGTRDLSDAVLTISECRYSIAQLRAQFPTLRPPESEAAMSRPSSTVDPAPMHPLVVGNHTTGLRGLALAAARHRPEPADDECMAELLRSAENYASDATATLDLSAERANALANLATSYSVLRWTVVLGVVAVMGIVIAILGVLLKG